MLTFAIASFERFQNDIYNCSHPRKPGNVTRRHRANRSGGDEILTAVGLTTSASFAEFESSLSSAVKTHASKGRVLILTDMFGGTPSRIGMTLHETGKVEVVTGVSLPMLLKALQLSESDEDLIDVAQKVRKAGERGISVASEILGEI